MRSYVAARGERMGKGVTEAKCENPADLNKMAAASTTPDRSP